jgi:serine/threonine protein kinase
MTIAIADSMPRRPLSQLLAEKPSWSLRERLLLARRLALAVQVLHRQGRIHRSLDAETITIDGQFDPQLDLPTGARRFGGDLSDPESCPPELAQGRSVELPAEIETAAAVLRERGTPFDPRRIDFYQLGVLLCQLLTGEPFLSYLYSPTCKAKVPPMARAILERCLGENAAPPLVDCDDLVAALDDLIGQLPEKQATSTSETPPLGSAVVSPGDTPPHGKSVPPSAETPAEKDQRLPFQRLGHFQIVDQIGAGGMGDVYRGYDASLDRYVAIKVLAPTLARDEQFVRRFVAEATAAAKLSHPNVVPIHFIGHDAGYHFFAMQFIEGQSLAQYLSSKKRLPVDQAVAIIEQCLAGLEAAHARDLIHRDVKPGNILLERASGRAILVDFGLVRHLNADSRMTATGVLMGTVDYVAPEQAKGKAIDGRADIYSLGVMFYELLAGHLPFLSDSPTAMIFQHAYEEPLPLKQAAPDVPQPLVDVVAHMMAKEPAERYPSCAAVLADLRAFCEGRPVEASSPDGVAVEQPLQQAVIADVLGDDEMPEGIETECLVLPSESPLQRARDWAATIFRRHAPQYIQEMQNTTQQMDGAVAHYQRRCKRLASLLAEARSIETALSDQQVEELEQQQSKAEATLARLRSQQGLLKARLQTAEAQRQMEGELPPSRRLFLPMPMLAIGGALLLAFGVLVLIESPPTAKVGSDYHGAILKRGHPIVESVPAKKVDFVIGPKKFLTGDQIVIEDVWSELGTLANGDTVTVKGTYTLASQPNAALSFYVTQDSRDPPDHSSPPGITRQVRAGSGSFEIKRPITCKGHLHVSFYDVQKGNGFGGVYFGTPAQMQEIAHWNL